MIVGRPKAAEPPGEPEDRHAGLDDPDLAAAILRTLPVAIYTLDMKGRLTSFNEAAARLLSGGGHWTPKVGDVPPGEPWQAYKADGSPMLPEECATTAAIREERPIRGLEFIVERPDGMRIPLVAHAAPLRDGEGRMVGVASALVDISERKRSELAGLHLASIVESSHDAIISKDINGVISTWNAGAQALFGYTAEEAIGQHINLLIPADRLEEEPKILERIRRGERVDHFETIRRRKDGSLVDISLTISPVRDREGQVIGASKIARDISERRLAEEQQRLLLHEMSHRIKNLFAVAGSLVTTSARSARTPAEMAGAVRARLDALNRAHELTRPGLSGGGDPTDARLDDLLAAIFRPYAERRDAGLAECVALSGPDVRLGGAAVTSFALIFHELATNAAKYGALTEPGGRVNVSWEVAGERLLLCWRESGGPRLRGSPTHRGFGSTLAARIIEGQFGGGIAYDWSEAGLAVHIDLDSTTLGYRGAV